MTWSLEPAGRGGNSIRRAAAELWKMPPPAKPSTVVTSWTSFTGGENGLRGITRPDLLGIDLDPIDLNTNDTLDALGHAAGIIAEGAADVMLAGGAESRFAEAIRCPAPGKRPASHNI